MRLNLPQRLGFAALGPLIVPVLLLRHGRTQFRKGNAPRYLRALPLTALLIVAWTAGEVWGCLTKRA